MIQMMKKPVSLFLAVLMIFSCFSVMGMTAYAENTETLLTTITATGKEQASYSVENVATVSFSYTTNGSSAYLNNGKTNWGWWGYGWIATVAPTEGYTITKCVFFDDKDRTATDSEAPFVVETTEEDKTPKVNGTPILADQSKGITKIEVYGYAVPSTYTVIWNNYDGTTLETDTDVEEGTIPTYNGATPTKADDAQYTYTFAGWTPEVVAATQDVTYIAQFTPVAKFSVFVKKLTGGTITVSNVTGLTTVAQLKDLLVTETGVPASAMRLIFAGKQLADDKTLGEYNIQKESTLHLVIRTYTITWKSDENTVIDTTNVAYGATPTHEDPAAYEDADYTYTFAGWTPEVVAATADATYTATFTATPKAHNGVNLTIGKDITSNYYVDYEAYTGAAKVRYTYNSVNEAEQNVPVTETVALGSLPSGMVDDNGRLVLEVSQAPAQMGEATVIEILDANDQVIDTLSYSSKTYCDNVLAMTVEQLAALPDVGTTEKAEELQTLCHTIIAYGQAAQGVFADYATTAVTCTSEEVNAQIEAATTTANHTVNNAGQIKFSGVSFVCTKDARLRFYLNTSEATSTPAAPTASTGNAALKYTLNGAEKQYFVEVSGINAADFNEQITVNYGGSTIKLSVLDFAGIVLRDGSGASAALQHFAKTLVVYNTNALAFFN